MQKKIIALAIAGLASTAAFAQTNVTIYGIADVGFEYSNPDTAARGNSKFRVQSGQSAGSRIGFKGVEDLGNGVSALFVAEMGFNFDNGQASSHGTNGGNFAGVGNGAAGFGNAAETGFNEGQQLFQRQAFAGLKTSMGTVTIGRQYTPFYGLKAKADAFGLGMNGTYNNVVGFVPGNADRLNNTVAYTSPTFSGVTAVVAYSAGQENANNQETGVCASAFGGTANCYSNAGKVWAGLVQYENGPVYAGFAYHRVNTLTLNANSTDTRIADAWMLGASYDLGVAKLFGIYSQGKLQNADTAAPNTVTRGNAFQVGVRVPMGKHTVIAAYNNGNNTTSATTGQNDARLFGLGYEYAMSKRTALYASYGKMYNSGAAASGINNAIANGLTTSAGGDPSSIITGVRHAF